ncbi:polysaccharide biosynthesis tyrosine autokinase [Paraburkholderia xenovorans]|uniref:polysaccharide biosynthesis tyrosine autokinase n=1 Tax=Paraburkholderia xenovorans TaxID=36873 RepID=UPI0038B9D0DE
MNDNNLRRNGLVPMDFVDARVADSNPDDVPLSSYVDIVMARWRLVLTITLFVFALGLLYVVFGTPVYQVDSTIQVDDSSSVSKTPLRDIGALLDSQSSSAAELELVRSRKVIDAVVDRLHLNIVAGPRYFPGLGRWMARMYKQDGVADARFGLARFAWGGEHIDVDRFTVLSSTQSEADNGILMGEKFTLTAQGDGRYVLTDEDDEVVLHGRAGEEATGIYRKQPVSLRVTTLQARPDTQFRIIRIPRLEAVTQLQTQLNVEEKAKQSGIISVTLEGDDKSRIETILSAVVNAYVQQNKDYRNEEAHATLDSLGRSMPEVRANLERAEAAYTAFRQRSGTVDLDEQGRLLLGQEVDVQTRILDLKQKQIDLVARYSDTHPAVISLEQSLSALQAQDSALKAKAEHLPQTEREGLSLLREVRVNTELYTNLLNTGQQLKIVEEGQIGSVRIVDVPELPVKPVKPRQALVLALSLCVGLALGIAAPFSLRAVWGRVEHSEQLEQALGVPVYAVIPHSRQQGRITRRQRRDDQGLHVLALDIPEDVSVDAVRSLRTTLHFTMAEAHNNVIMVTSSQPGAGKSFLSANLAAVFASGGKRVLLIDADMRRGQAHRYFGVPATPGLPDAITSGSLERAVKNTSVAGVDVLARGVAARSPELLNDGRFKALLETASRCYDIVVVDTPPILALHDAAAIGRLGATTLLCVRYGRSSMPEIREAERRLRNAGIQIGGVVLNDVPRRQAVYGSYGEGAYAYETEV